MKSLFAVICSFCILFSAAVSYAAESPTDKIKTGIEKVLTVLNSDLPDDEKFDKCLQATDDVFSWHIISGLSLGKYWNSMNGGQRKEFIDIFSKFLGRVYFSKIKDQGGDVRIEYTGESIRGNRARVSTVVYKNGISLPVVYSMYLSPDGWKAYDISVEGVSLVMNYRAQFYSFLENNTVDQLILELKKKL